MMGVLGQASSPPWNDSNNINNRVKNVKLCFHKNAVTHTANPSELKHVRQHVAILVVQSSQPPSTSLTICLGANLSPRNL